MLCCCALPSLLAQLLTSFTSILLLPTLFSVLFCFVLFCFSFVLVFVLFLFYYFILVQLYFLTFSIQIRSVAKKGEVFSPLLATRSRGKVRVFHFRLIVFLFLALCIFTHLILLIIGILSYYFFTPCYISFCLFLFVLCCFL